MTDPVSLPVLSAKPVAARQALVSVDASASPGLLASHTLPGQYVKAAIFDDEVARPLALCNKPGSTVFEFLLKAPPAADGEARLARLLALTRGDKVAVSPAQGKGFPLDRTRGGSLYLVGVGSGIAPLKSVVDVVAEARTDWSDVVVLYGVRDPDELAFKEKFATWAGLSIAVIPVVSRPDDAWGGKVGHVQDHLPHRFTSPERVHAFVCGLPEMEKAVSHALLARGVAPERVSRNW